MPPNVLLLYGPEVANDLAAATLTCTVALRLHANVATKNITSEDKKTPKRKSHFPLKTHN